MRIKEIIYQHRRDFRAVYICEHCGNEETSSGYDDQNFHKNVIPEIICKKCGKKSPKNYRPLATKYADNEVI